MSDRWRAFRDGCATGGMLSVNKETLSELLADRDALAERNAKLLAALRELLAALDQSADACDEGGDVDAMLRYAEAEGVARAALQSEGSDR